MLTMALLATLFTAAQCPGIRPAFSWTSNGNSIVFSDETQSSSYITGRQWQFGDGDMADAVATTHIYDTAAAHTVVLTIYSEGCSFSTSGLVVHGGVNDLCSSQISSSFLFETAGNNHMVFTDQSQGDGSFLLYLWTFGDDSASFDQSDEHFYIEPGAYDVSHSIGTVDSLFQTACVAGRAERIYVDGNTSTCDSSLFLELNVNEGLNPAPFDAQAVLLNGDLEITGWSWDYGDATAYVGTSAEHYYNYPGEYQLCVQVDATDTTTGDTCFARACATLAPAVVGVGETLRAPDLHAWPVPFSDEVWISSDVPLLGQRWRLLDALGREVMAGTFVTQGPQYIVTGRLPPGVYSLMLWNGATARSLRLLKH